MPWIRFRRGALQWRGIDRTPGFDEWAQGEGRPVVDDLVARKRFSLLPKRWLVLRQLRRELRQACGSETLSQVIQTQVSGFFHLLAEFAYVDALPRTRTARRLVVVPRVLINGAAFRQTRDRLQTHPELAQLTGGEPLRYYLFLQLVQEIDRALLSASPSPRRPVIAEGEWVVVGVDLTYAWFVPLQPGPVWQGHYLLYEAPRGRMRRADRKAFAVRMKELEPVLVELSRSQRDEILRSARR